MTRSTLISVLGATIWLAACSTVAPIKPSPGHIQRDNLPPPPAASIPQPVEQSVALARPRAAPRAETYSVVVNNIGVQELLFALARDAKLNVDIHPGISGTVTLNAIDQTLPQLLSRIAKQVDVRYELDGPNLAVMPDSPFLRTYKVDYVNMSRDTSGSVAVTTQIATAGTGAVGGAASGTGGVGGNSSITRIENFAKNRFWETLIQNIKDLLRETDKILPDGTSETVIERADSQSTSGTGSAPHAGGGGKSSSTNGIANSPNPATLQQAGTTVVKRNTFREAASVIANPETGILTVRATSRQQEKVQEFIDQVQTSAQRQVLIEATVAEVQLNENYQQGIDWSRLRLDGTGFTLRQTARGNVSAPPSSVFELSYTNPGSRIGNIGITARLLETFGTVKVLSSPKLSVLNNQTAVLKVVDNTVYFTIESNINQNQTQTVTVFTTTVHTVPVGFVMNVTPQISSADAVLLNIRPSISRIVGLATDPNPAFRAQGITNQIPIIRSREMESMIRVDNGNIAVMGGLMEDVLDNADNAVPGLAQLPLIGNFFTYRNDTKQKTELVIFLRPTVIRHGKPGGDIRNFEAQLPDKDFFANNPGPLPTRLDFGAKP